MKKEIVEKFARTKGDTGSPEVQIALSTSRILMLTEHCKKHKKDHHSRRGLHALVNLRKGMLRYLKNRYHGRYQDVIKALSLKG